MTSRQIPCVFCGGTLTANRNHQVCTGCCSTTAGLGTAAQWTTSEKNQEIWNSVLKTLQRCGFPMDEAVPEDAPASDRVRGLLERNPLDFVECVHKNAVLFYQNFPGFMAPFNPQRDGRKIRILPHMLICHLYTGTKFRREVLMNHPLETSLAFLQDPLAQYRRSLGQHALQDDADMLQQLELKLNFEALGEITQEIRRRNANDASSDDRSPEWTLAEMVHVQQALVDFHAPMDVEPQPSDPPEPLERCIATLTRYQTVDASITIPQNQEDIAKLNSILGSFPIPLEAHDGCIHLVAKGDVSESKRETFRQILSEKFEQQLQQGQEVKVRVAVRINWSIDAVESDLFANYQKLFIIFIRKLLIFTVFYIKGIDMTDLIKENIHFTFHNMTDYTAVEVSCSKDAPLAAACAEAFDKLADFGSAIAQRVDVEFIKPKKLILTIDVPKVCTLREPPLSKRSQRILRTRQKKDAMP